MTIKIIAIDMDGTLLNEDSKIATETKETILEAKKRGIKIVLCTGRPLIGVRAYLQELELTEQGDYVITYNGSLVQRADNEEVIVKHSLSYEDYIDVEALSRKLKLHCHTEDEHFIYTSNRDISPYTIFESYLTTMPLKFRMPEEMPSDVPFGKMMFIDEPEKIDAAMVKIPSAFYERFNLIKSAPYFLEILNKKASKGTGLAELATFLGCDASNCMAIGDADNDLAMLEYAGLSVAMANATPKVKEISDVETLSNRDNGVAAAIRQYAF